MSAAFAALGMLIQFATNRKKYIDDDQEDDEEDYEEELREPVRKTPKKNTRRPVPREHVKEKEACIGLGGGSYDRLGKLFIFTETFGKLYAADLAYAGSIFTPGAAGEVAADDHFDTETFAFHARSSHGIDFGEFPVGNHFGCSIEEVVCDLIKNQIGRAHV